MNRFMIAPDTISTIRRSDNHWRFHTAWADFCLSRPTEVSHQSPVTNPEPRQPCTDPPRSGCKVIASRFGIEVAMPAISRTFYPVVSPRRFEAAVAAVISNGSTANSVMASCLYLLCLSSHSPDRDALPRSSRPQGSRWFGTTPAGKRVGST